MLESDGLRQCAQSPASLDRYREGRSVNLKPHPPDTMPDDVGQRGFRVTSMRRRIAISVSGTLLVAALLAYILAGRGAQFSAALGTAPITLIALSVLLQIAALLTRT